MIETWFEPFALLERQTAPDGMGGEEFTLVPTLTFMGALTFVAGDEKTAAGQLVMREAPVLLHEYDVTLQYGDHIRREQDSAVYRVTSRSGAMRTPAFSGLRFAQVNVERVVIPC